jgi:polar amino acid transport system permease protein
MIYASLSLVIRYWGILQQAFVTTVIICAVSGAIGLTIGLFICLIKMYARGPLRYFAVCYIEIFRAVPEIVLIFWAYSCLPLLLNFKASDETTGILILACVTGAFSAEIFRAGLESIPRGQYEAADALGLSLFWIWYSAILPQAVRRVLVPLVMLGADLIKGSSLLSAIGVRELTGVALDLGSTTYRYFEFFSAIAVAYYVLISAIQFLAGLASRRMVGVRR